MRTRPLAALLLPVLAGCAGPVFVPEAGPGAPGYSERPAPPPVEVEFVQSASALPAGGAIDSVVPVEGGFEVAGWALVDAAAPRGLLQLVLPAGVEGQVEEVQTVPRPDVVAATGDQELAWAGFSIRVGGALPEGTAVCVLSRSSKGEFQLGGSDAGLCPG